MIEAVVHQHHIDPSSDEPTSWMDAWVTYRRRVWWWPVPLSRTVVFTLDTTEAVASDRDLSLSCAKDGGQYAASFRADADSAQRTIDRANADGAVVNPHRRKASRWWRRRWTDWQVTTRSILDRTEAERLMALVLRREFHIEPSFKWEPVNDPVIAI